MEAVLGISLGTCSIGLAIIRDRKLIDWHLRSFNRKWSEEKLKAIIGSIDRQMDQNLIRAVGIKIPDLLPTSEGFMRVVGALNRLIESRSITARYYTLSELKEAFCPDTKASKGALARCVMQKYPDLYLVYYSGNTRKSRYYAKLFEAAGAASLAAKHL